MSQVTYIALVTAILLVIPALIGIIAGRGDRAVAAARTLALIAAGLSAFGGVLIYLGTGPLEGLPSYGAVAYLIDGFALFGVGYVLALTACTMGLTHMVKFREWGGLGLLSAALVVLLVAAGLGDYAFLGTVGSQPSAQQLTTWITVASGVAALGAFIVTVWSIRAGRTSLGAGRTVSAPSP